jgi:hypothetical protein
MSDEVKKNTWVKVYRIVLNVGERASHIPEETARVPLEMRVNGFLTNETAHIGETVTVTTLSGRIVEGTLIEIEPKYTHSFGNYIPELGCIGSLLRERLERKEDHE